MSIIVNIFYLDYDIPYFNTFKIFIIIPYYNDVGWFMTILLICSCHLCEDVSNYSSKYEKNMKNALRFKYVAQPMKLLNYLISKLKKEIRLRRDVM